VSLRRAIDSDEFIICVASLLAMALTISLLVWLACGGLL